MNPPSTSDAHSTDPVEYTLASCNPRCTETHPASPPPASDETNKSRFQAGSSLLPFTHRPLHHKSSHVVLRAILAGKLVRAHQSLILINATTEPPQILVPRQNHLGPRRLRPQNHRRMKPAYRPVCRVKPRLELFLCNLRKQTLQRAAPVSRIALPA